MKLIPRSRFSTWWRIVLACVVVVGFAAATTTVAGLLQVKNVVNDFNQNAPIKHLTQIQLPAPGKPETILLIGADHRYNEGSGIGNTDTMLLVRINDSSSTINMLSVPRDLAVRDPSEGLTKLNAIYSSYGANQLLKTLSSQVFPGLKVNHVIIVSFLGFSKLIDKIGCVYAQVDHRYYNNTATTDYSSIDIQPGYQRLCGWNAASNGALAFVRFRHTDSDLVREARQQDFIRWAKQNFTTSELASNETQLLKTLGKYSQTDDGFHHPDAFIELAGLAINANGATLKSIPFPAESYPVIGGVDYVESTTADEDKVFHEFMHPTTAPVKKPAAPSPPSGKRRKHHTKPHALSTAGLIADPGDGKSQAGQLGRLKFPVYYPKLINADSQYCFSLTEDCIDNGNPSSVYTDSYPRRYSIKAPDKKRYPAYVMTLEDEQQEGQYYTIQGTTWRDPPILRDPTSKLHVGGRTLYEYNSGGHLTVVAFHTSRGVYWVSNTLTNFLPNSQMLAIADSFTPAG